MLRRFLILLLLAALTLAFGCAPAKFTSPQLHASLCDKEGFTQQELQNSKTKIPLNTEGKVLVNNYGHWNDSLSMTWFDENKMGFIRNSGNNQSEGSYFVYDLTAQELYQAEDEFTISRINEKHHSTEIRQSNVTDKNKNVGGQILGFLAAAACADKTEVYQAKIGNETGDTLYDYYRTDELEGNKVAMPFGLGWSCNHTLESRSCRLNKAGVDGGGRAVPCLGSDYGFITEDETLFVNGNYVMDMRSFEVFPGALVDVDASSAPVLVKYTIAPNLEKIALLFADTNDYIMEIVDIDLDEMAKSISAGEAYVPSDPEKPRYVYSNMSNRPNMFSVVVGDLFVYQDRFEFISEKGTETLRFNEITGISKTLMSSGVVIKGSSSSFDFHENGLSNNGLMTREDAVSKFKSISSI